MRLTPTEVEGCHVADLEPHGDERGFFARAWCRDELAAVGAGDPIVQINMSLSHAAGTTRGLHWQVAPHAEAKFVRCVAGAVFDVCVDVRPDSPTHGRWVGVRLDTDNRSALYIPAGCAHGYQTLEDDTELLYSTSAPYAPDAERGARPDDPAFGVEWPMTATVLSDKDRSWPDYVAG